MFNKITTTLLIWLAQKLITYFLKSRLDLSNELTAALERQRQYEAELAQYNKDIEAVNIQIAKAGELFDEKYNKLIDLHAEIDQLDREHHEKLKETTDRINSMSDDAVLHVQL